MPFSMGWLFREHLNRIPVGCFFPRCWRCRVIFSPSTDLRMSVDPKRMEWYGLIMDWYWYGYGLIWIDMGWYGYGLIWVDIDMDWYGLMLDYILSIYLLICIGQRFIYWWRIGQQNWSGARQWSRMSRNLRWTVVDSPKVCHCWLVGVSTFGLEWHSPI